MKLSPIGGTDQARAQQSHRHPARYWLSGVLLAVFVASLAPVQGLSLIHISEPTRPY